MLTITVTKEINGKNEKLAAKIDEDAPLSVLNQELHAMIGALLDREAEAN